MTNIISFKDKKGLVEQKEAELIRKRKVLAVRKVFQCTQCALKCEKCGTQIERRSDDTADYHRRERPLDFSSHAGVECHRRIEGSAQSR